MNIKKYLDRHLFSRLGLQIAFSVLVIILLSVFGTLLRNWATGHSAPDIYSQAFWGFRQITDGGSMAGTLDGLDEVAAESPNGFAAPVVLIITVGAWLVGLVLYGFVAGAIANAFAGRKDKIDAGEVRYRFRDHGVVFGWDFQGPACVGSLLGDCAEVLVVSGTDPAAIREELEQSLGGDLLGRVFIYNGQVAADEGLLADSWPELARRVVILGERDGSDNDGANLYVERLLRRHMERAAERRGAGRPPVKVYLHIENPVLHSQALSVSKDGLAGNDDLIDLEVFNYHESWAWRCWSAKGAGDGDSGQAKGGDVYLPLRHRPEAERVELFIVGAGKMGLAMARYALPLLNYGEDSKHCKVTVFDCSPEDRAALPEKAALDALPETEVALLDVCGLSDEANETMLKAASDPKTAVTVVVAPEGADAAVRAYAGLANALRRMDVSILVWQRTALEKCPAKAFLQTCGDRAKLRFFGMTDVLPWMDPAREAAGAAVNYFYDLVFNRDGKTGERRDPSLSDADLPATDAAGFADAAKSAWDEGLALERWRKVERWKRWSSVNAADCFKEKAAAFQGFAADPAARLRMLRAEHNRWWTERLLAGWKPCPKPADKAGEKTAKAAFTHWDMVPFDQLDASTKELDRVPLAAMVALGFGK